MIPAPSSSARGPAVPPPPRRTPPLLLVLQPAHKAGAAEPEVPALLAVAVGAAAAVGSPRWSPDSKWIAYVRSLKGSVGAAFLYSLATGKSHQITDGMSDARHVAFDKGGKYLFFTASTDIGPSVGSGMSVLNRGVTRSASSTPSGATNSAAACETAAPARRRMSAPSPPH